MTNIKKIISNDGYPTYQIEKDSEILYLGNKENYKQNIDSLVECIEGLAFDSIVFIFGIDSGEYINALKSNICSYNKVIIIEPNKDIYLLNRYRMLGENIELVLFEEENIRSLINSVIFINHIERLFVHSFGNYEEIYMEEYKKFINILDNRYYSISANINLNYRYKNLFFKDMLSNLPKINNSTSLNTNTNTNINLNIPAIIVSAGPSLDQNIQTLIKNKDKLDKFFIIASNRTMGALIENNIRPNLVVSVDPVDEIYEMMQKYINEDVPLAFYEYSNKDLVKEYKGEKIYIAQLLPKLVEELKGLAGTFTGGSVAHTCIDIATILGCNPIIFIGQDCAITYGKHHSDNSTFGFDAEIDNKKTSMITTKDVFGEEIKTTATLEFFKTKIEEYINTIQKFFALEFINCSYGAEILGAPHMELEEILNSNKYTIIANPLKFDKDVKIDTEQINNSILNHINEFIKKSEDCIKICDEILEKDTKESMVDMDENDVNLQQFLYTQQVVDEFEFSTLSNYIGGYVIMFLYEVREKYFTMEAKDYEKLTSNLKYHCNNFLNYFIELKKMLEELKELYYEVIPKNE